jgi:hypothetical protein
MLSNGVEYALRTTLTAQALFLISMSLLFLAAFAGTATAQAPVTSNLSPTEKHRQKEETIFYSKQVLSKSIAEIGGMPEAELRSLAHYFAECDNTTAQKTHACSAAQSAYLIEYGANRPMDDWIVARSGLDQLEEMAREIAPHKGPPIDVEQIINRAKIEMVLHDAINQRFKVLRSTERSP